MWKFLQKIAHCDGDFLHVGFERKVSGIQELDSRVGVVASGASLLCYADFPATTCLTSAM
jgi:hypothetical protein